MEFLAHQATLLMHLDEDHYHGKTWNCHNEAHSLTRYDIRECLREFIMDMFVRLRNAGSVLENRSYLGACWLLVTLECS